MFVKEDAKERIANVDFLRIFAMFTIVVCHATIHLGWMLNGNINEYSDLLRAILYTIVHIGQVGVAIFFMISGYFLCKKSFRLSRVISIVVQTLSYALILLILFYVLSKLQLVPLSIRDMFNKDSIFSTVSHGVVPVFSNAYWFITTYVVLLLLSPFANSLIKITSKNKLIILIVILLLLNIWSLCTPYVNFFKQICYALVCYLLGAFVRIHDIKRKRLLSGNMWVLVVVLLMLAMFTFNFVALSDWTLPNLLNWRQRVISDNGLRFVEILIALILFLRCAPCSKVVVIKGRWGAVLSNISAAIFGVYLIHENQFVYRILWSGISSLTYPVIACSNFIIRILIMLCVSIGVYTACLVVAYIYHRVVASHLVIVVSRLSLIKSIGQRVDNIVNT